MNESDTVLYEVCVYVEQKAYLALHFLFFKPTTTSRMTMWQKSWIDLTPAEVLLSLRYLPLLFLTFSLSLPTFIIQQKALGTKRTSSTRWVEDGKGRQKRRVNYPVAHPHVPSFSWLLETNSPCNFLLVLLSLFAHYPFKGPTNSYSQIN